MNKIFGLYSNDPKETEQRIRELLQGQYKQPIIFTNVNNHTAYTQQFQIFYNVVDEHTAKTILQSRYKNKADFVSAVPTKDYRTIVQKRDKIRIGVIMFGLASGGITRSILSMMEAPIEHDIEWSGIATASIGNFNLSVAERVLRYCDVYSYHGNGYVKKSDNPFQEVVDRSDVIYFNGFVHDDPKFSETNFRGKPFIIGAHGTCTSSKKHIGTALKYCTRYIPIGVSENVVNTTYPEDLSSDVVVIHNSINFSRIAPTVDRKTTRESWGISDDKIAIGYVGRLAHDKNPLVVARAASLSNNFHAVYVGEGYAEDHYKTEAKKLYKDTTFVPHTEDIGSIYAALDCLIISSPSEGGPITVAEAWAAGVPVVSTPVGMIPELERDYGKLTVTISHDPTDKQLEKAVRKAVKSKAMIKRAREMAWGHFNQSRQLKKFEGVAKQLYSSHKKSVGFYLDTCAMGGVTRGMLSLMKSNCDRIRWSGVALYSPFVFDIDIAREILKHCPIYAEKDHPSYQGLVTIVDNPCQTVIDNSDFVKLWGTIRRKEFLNKANWNDTVVITAAHGECEWTKQNIDTSLTYGDQHILYAVSEGGRKCFPKNLQKSVRILHNGLDTTRLKVYNKLDARKRLGIPLDNKEIIGYIGRLDLSKNIALLHRFTEKYGDYFQSLIVGDGFQKLDIQLMIKDNLNARLLDKTDDVGLILSALDYLVLASPSEGCPNVIMEAFHAKCRVVATSVGFIPHLEKQYGKLCGTMPDNPTVDDLLKAIQSYESPMSERAYDVCQKEFSLNTYVNNFQDMILDSDIICNS